ncbi:MAG TPA: hypothetical protein VHX42_02915, partial [Candidatus Babeliales bacterium]|nr:hypothetical protein [Candidatus Babeliales bacterium]
EKYQALIKQAKDAGVEKKELDAIEAKMKELQDKFGVVPALQQSKIPAPVMASATRPNKEEAPSAHETMHTEEAPPVK